jgi:protein-tyrosine kinase
MRMKKEAIRPEQVISVGNRGRSIGALLVDSRRLSAEDAEAVMRYADDENLRFGDAAIKLGLVTRADLQYALARQFDYPFLDPDDESLSREVVAAYAPFSAAVEMLRVLRTQLSLRWFQPLRKMLSVVSARRGDGRSYVAANLAVVYSQLGERTLLIDADLRNPRQHEIFHLPNRLGLSALLARRGDEDVVHRVRGLLGLSVMPAGAAPPNPQELLGRLSFEELLAQMGAQYDVIIVDTPAGELGADFQSVSAVTEGALLVTRRDHSRVSEARAIADAISSSGGHIAGAVLNDH